MMEKFRGQEKVPENSAVHRNADDALDIFICAVLIHYQFESIHPFLDEAF